MAGNGPKSLTWKRLQDEEMTANEDPRRSPVGIYSGASLHVQAEDGTFAPVQNLPDEGIPGKPRARKR